MLNGKGGIRAVSGELNTQQIDALAATMSNIRFSVDGSNVSEFKWLAKRRGNSLVFKHNKLSITVENFNYVNWAAWENKIYPAVENRVIQYLYRADVNAEINDTKVAGNVTLGYWKSREELLAPLGRNMERDVIDALLIKIDKVCMGMFPFEN